GGRVTGAAARLADPAAALAEVRRVAPALAERAGRHDADGSYPAEDMADLRAAGLTGLMVPTRLGGAGAGFADYADIALELGAAHGSTALIYNMHASVTGALAQIPEDVARALGVPEEALAARDRILRAAADGAWYAVAMSERGAGSRLSAIPPSYRLVASDWQLSGEKSFVSGAGHADGYLVAARGEDGRISQFLVPAGPGLTVRPAWDSLGMRATASHDLLIDTVVPPDALLGGIEGLALPVAQLMPQWLVASYAAVYVGVARSAVDAAAAHLRERGLDRLPAVRARLRRPAAQGPRRPP